MIFNINCDFLLFEAYCEFWARMFNIGFISFMMCEKKQFSLFQKYANVLLSFERVYGVSQFKKILDWFSTNYLKIIIILIILIFFYFFVSFLFPIFQLFGFIIETISIIKGYFNDLKDILENQYFDYKNFIEKNEEA